MDYYRAAIQYIAENVSKPVFYVFSDDIPWSRENFDVGFRVEFVDVNDGGSAFEDLRLMQHCKHHIIANSTFSWWGAWLNPNPDKIVVAPEKWLLILL